MRPSSTRERTIPTEWLSGLPPNEQQDIKAQWELNPQLMQRLSQLIKNRIEATFLDFAPDYTNPNWAYRRAHDNGQHVAYQEILRLLP